jgi:hypothetical protein
MATSVISNGSGWRTGWARRENARRKRTHAAATSAWARADAELRAMVGTARAGRPVSAEQVPWLTLRRGESVLWHSPGVRLVSRPDHLERPALRPPGFADFTPSQLTGAFVDHVPSQFPVLDSGPLAITSTRIAFGGARPRDWVHVRVLGVAHDPRRTLTWLEDASGSDLTGLVLDPYAVAGFRFTLTLALADAGGRRQSFAEHLERLLAAHQRTRPAPPPAADPEEAPTPAQVLFGGLRKLCLGPAGASVVRRSVQCATVVAATLVLATMALADPRPTSALSAARSTGERAVAPSRSTPPGVVAAPRPTSTAPVTRSEEAIRPEPTSVPTTASPERTPTPAPSRAARSRVSEPGRQPVGPVSGQDGLLTAGVQTRCGAPVNPYGYHYCSSGPPVGDPEPGVCGYFRCASDFWSGTGFMVQCRDDSVSLAGGRPDACELHRGVLRVVRGGH